MAALLELSDVTRRFGGVAAVDGLSFALEAGETLGIMGPNGAGKTSLLNVITGVYPPSEGRITFQGEDITGLSPVQVCHRGIGRTYQIPQPFGTMSVRENVMVGCVYGPKGASSGREARALADGILERTGLAGRADRVAKSLSLLELKRLELARALSLQPKLILLDEIGAGLIKQEIAELKALIGALQASGLSIIMIEHVLEFIFDLCERVLVLDWGCAIAEGKPEDVAKDQKVIDIYLGSQGTSPAGRDAAVCAVEPHGCACTPGEDGQAAPLLVVEDIDVSYGAFQALSGVSLELHPGEVVALVGANGSGKTTVVRTIGGLLQPSRGGIDFCGRRLSGLATHDVVRLGVAHCPEGRQVFPDLSVLENLELGAYTKRARARAKENLTWVFELFPVLAERRSQQASTLSGGQQQMLAIGRALMADPTLLLLDEVSLGLAPVVIDELYDAIRTINARGVSVLLVEQNIHRSLEISHRAYILEGGKVVREGTSAELAGDDRVAEHYFGF